MIPPTDSNASRPRLCKQTTFSISLCLPFSIFLNYFLSNTERFSQNIPLILYNSNASSLTNREIPIPSLSFSYKGSCLLDFLLQNSMEKKREERDGGMTMNWDGIVEGMPLFAKELVAGGVAGGIAKTAVAPLERIKILFQTRRAEFQSIGLLGSFSKIAKTEGLLGFYRGNGASVARIVPYAALHYMTYEEYRRWIILGIPGITRGPVLDLIAGSFAGATAVLCTYPLDLVRTKLAYQVVGSQKLNVKGLLPSEQVYKGILDCFSKTCKEAGVRGLYRGVAPSLYGIFPYAGLKFYFYEEMKSHVPEDHKKDIMVKLACGSVAGLLGQTFTYPLDVVRRQMQVQRLSASNRTDMKGTIETLVMIVQRHGWKQLFSGLSLNYLKVVPSVAIGFTVYDVMKSFLRVPSRDEAVIEVTTNRRNSQPSSLPS